MIAEQTFRWLGRFKKILNSMGKNHFHFMLHRIVKKRNEYTEYCHLVGKYPLLPSAKLSKINKWLLFFIIASLLNNVIKNWIWLHCIVFLFKTSVNISSVSSKLSFFLYQVAINLSFDWNYFQLCISFPVGTICLN